MTINNKDYDVLGKTTCDCGYTFNTKDIKELKDVKEKGFYGNLVKYYSTSKCPKCGKEVLLLLKQKGQTYDVLDIAIEKSMQELTSNSKISTEKIVDNELICPVCQRTFKNKAGLNVHIKTHQN